MSELLTRDEFRAAVFARDNNKCVICSASAVDAHHIIERRLWPDGGYYLDNGASLCARCHLKAERTVISVEVIRQFAKVKKIIPNTLYDDETYDKWGNVYMTSGMRAPGELFYDPSVQKVLKYQLNDFFVYTKHPRTPHLPWSPGFTDDDIEWSDANSLMGIEVVVTEKMDGENTTMYKDYIHARSLTNGQYDPTRTWVKNFHGSIAHDIPDGWRVCGENLYAKHSIYYDDLPSYFLVHSIWDREKCLSWDDTLFWCNLLEVTPVSTIWRGIYDEHFEDKVTPLVYAVQDKMEGYVVRPSGAFTLSTFRNYVAKWVRPNHITTDRHWRNKALTVNKLK